MQSRLRSTPRWLIVFVAITLSLLLYNAPDIYTQLPETWKHRRGSFLMLFEMNYPTWWTSMLLLASALLLLESANTRDRILRNSSLVLAMLIGALSVDEIGSVHERVSLFSDARFGSPWAALAPFVLMGVIALLYGVRGLFRSDLGTRAAVFISLGFGVFALVVLQEYLEHHPTFPKFMMQKFGIKPGGRIVLEEVTEMIGAMLVLVGSALVRSRGRFGPAIGFALCRPSSIRRLQLFLAAGLTVHCTIAFFFLPDRLELTLRGNPAGWYPTAVFFIVFCHAYWQFRDYRDGIHAGTLMRYGLRDKTSGAAWLTLCVFSLLCSIGFLHNYGHLVGAPLLGVQKAFFFNLFVIYIALTCTILFLAAWLDLRSKKHLICLLLVLLAPAVEFGISDPGSGFAASGIFAFLTAILFLTPEYSDSAS